MDKFGLLIVVSCMAAASIAGCSLGDRSVPDNLTSIDRSVSRRSLEDAAARAVEGRGVRYVHIVDPIPHDLSSAMQQRTLLHARADFARGEVDGAVYALGSPLKAATRRLVDEIVATTPRKRLSGARVLIINSDYDVAEASSIERQLGAKVVLVQPTEGS